MAFSKKHKGEMLDQYGEWLGRSQAVFLLEYHNMTQKDVDTLRAKVREAGGEMHVVKNTLFDIALKNSGHDVSTELGTGANIVSFAFEDAAGLAKLLKESTAKSEVFKVKGGYLGIKRISNEEVRALADLPPLPVMRAQLLGTLLAPASQLVRTLAEPGRSLAAVLQANVDKANAGSAAAA